MTQPSKSPIKPPHLGSSTRGGASRHGNEQKASISGAKIQDDTISKIIQVLVASHLATLIIWLSLLLLGVAIDSDLMAGGILVAVLTTTVALLYCQHLRGQLNNSGQTTVMQDRLTLLPDRRHFLHHLDLVIRRSSRVHMKFALLMFDIKGFGEISQKYGRDTGDELLCQLADRLSARIRATDELARWDADQFTMILENVSTKRDIEKLVTGLLQDLSQPLRIGEEELIINARVGAAIYPDHSADGSALMSDAYEAMCRARSTPSGGYFLFDPDVLNSKETFSTH